MTACVFYLREMLPLNFPKAPLALSNRDGRIFVNCLIRRKPLVLTPEEWVRQHAVNFLIEHIGVPIGRIAIEHVVKINGQSRRCDLLVFSEDGQPLLVMECKEPETTLSERTFLQVSNYVGQLKARYFMMTNGLQHVIARIEGTGFVYLSEIPAYSNW